MKINLNETVKVKLTEIGIQHLAKLHYELDDMLKIKTGKGIGHFVLRLDEQGYYSTQMWSLFEKFAPFMGLAKPNPFIGNEIIVSDELNKIKHT